jgi:hypothetical protein
MLQGMLHGQHATPARSMLHGHHAYVLLPTSIKAMPLYQSHAPTATTSIRATNLYQVHQKRVPQRYRQQQAPAVCTHPQSPLAPHRTTPCTAPWEHHAAPRTRRPAAAAAPRTMHERHLRPSTRAISISPSPIPRHAVAPHALPLPGLPACPCPFPLGRGAAGPDRLPTAVSLPMGPADQWVTGARVRSGAETRG